MPNIRKTTQTAHRVAEDGTVSPKNASGPPATPFFFTAALRNRGRFTFDDFPPPPEPPDAGTEPTFRPLDDGGLAVRLPQRVENGDAWIVMIHARPCGDVLLWTALRGNRNVLSRVRPELRRFAPPGTPDPASNPRRVAEILAETARRHWLRMLEMPTILNNPRPSMRTPTVLPPPDVEGLRFAAALAGERLRSVLGRSADDLFNHFPPKIVADISEFHGFPEPPQARVRMGKPSRHLDPNTAAEVQNEIERVVAALPVKGVRLHRETKSLPTSTEVCLKQKRTHNYIAFGNGEPKRGRLVPLMERVGPREEFSVHRIARAERELARFEHLNRRPD